MEAFEEFGLAELFKNILPAGNQKIKVVLDPSLKGTDTHMQNPSAGLIKVNPDLLNDHSNAYIAATIGHELMHVNDPLRGNVNTRNRISVINSEIRAYQWGRRNAGHFYSEFEDRLRYKSLVTTKIRECTDALEVAVARNGSRKGC